MSRRDRSATSPPRKEWSRDDEHVKATRPSIIGIVIPAALALVASAVFFARLTAPGSFLGAVAGIELAQLAANDRLGAAARGPSWRSLGSRHLENCRRLPTWKQHLALGDMLDALVAIERGRRDPAMAARIATEAVAADPENLVARLACGVILDGSMATTEAAESVGARFLALQRIVEGSAPAATSTLHNHQIDASWFDTLASGLRRADTAMALARFADHYEITQHYAALPMIERRISGLADALSEAGRAEDSKLCRSWLVRMLVGVMEDEPDAGTQLLCADLLARTLEDTRPELAVPLRQLRGAYHVHAAAAPTDLGDPSRSPVLDASGYRVILAALVVTLVFAACALGAGLLLGAAIVMLPISAMARVLATRRGRPSQTEPAMHSRRALFRILLCLLGPALVSIILAARITSDSVFSEYWLYVVFLCTGFAGAMFVMLQTMDASRTAASAPPSKDAQRMLRSPWAVVAIIAALPLLAIAAPPSLTANLARWFDLQVPFLSVLLIAFPLLAIICVWRLRARLRMMLLLASVSWALNILVAWVALGFLLGADEGASLKAAYSRRHELNHRLGSNWQQKYLDPVKSAYDITTP